MLRVDRSAYRMVIVYPSCCAADRLDDAAKFYRANGRAREKRCEEKMIAGADNRHVIIVYINFIDETETRKPGAENDEFLFVEVHAKTFLNQRGRRFTFRDLPPCCKAPTALKSFKWHSSAEVFCRPRG